jgi:hypothetical protein
VGACYAAINVDQPRRPVTAVAQLDAIRERADAAEALRLAARYVWWQTPETTLSDIDSLLCRIMTDGTAEDYVAACKLWGEAAFMRALERAPPGAVDERSWRFWHLHFKIPLRPYPRRRLP